ncbi:MAG: putative membrane protein [Rhodobacteraceae bacterium HLUCCA08]|nr:MAG: putative membrane protein [Rhodobacteraceae bacterium HLUCCA08]
MKAAAPRDIAVFTALALVVLASLPLALVTAGSARAGRPVLVLAGPLAGGAPAVITRAGGVEVGPTVAPLGRIAVLPDIALARREGAWIIVDAAALATLCGP